MVWFPSDFQDESMLNKVRQMVKLIVQWHPESESKLNKLLQTLMTHLTAIEKHEKALEKLSIAKNNCQIQDLLQMEFSATDFAQVKIFAKSVVISETFLGIRSLKIDIFRNLNFHKINIFKSLIFIKFTFPEP